MYVRFFSIHFLIHWFGSAIDIVQYT
jgi:hypothetical protein